MSLPKLKLTISQKGFALLPLIVLLLVGIAAGTLLIQNRTNFLPNAQQTPTVKLDPLHPDIPDDGKVRIQYNTQCDGDKRYWQIVKGRTLEKSGDTACNRDGRPCIGLQNEPACPSSQCKKFTDKSSNESPFIGECTGSTTTPTAGSTTNDQPASARACKDDELLRDRKNANSGLKCASGTKCVIDGLETRTCLPDDFPGEGQPCPQALTNNCAPYEGDKRQCVVIGLIPRCRYPDSTESKDGKSGCKGADLTACFTGEECWTYNDSSKGTFKYSACRKSSGSAPAAAAPAAGAPANGTPARTSSTANGPATVPVTGARPASGTAPTAAAPAAQTASQTRQNASVSIPTTPVEVTKKACAEEWMNTHCREKESTFCNEIDSNARCAYPESATKCNSNDDKCGAGDECVLIPFKVSGDSKTYKYSICKSAYKGSSSTPGAAAPGTPAAVTDVMCGKDKDGIDIPCYAIGVFSQSELTAREAQAKIASANYSKLRKILDDEEAKIGKEVADKAREKIAAAEKAMQACLK